MLAKSSTRVAVAKVSFYCPASALNEQMFVLGGSIKANGCALSRGRCVLGLCHPCPSVCPSTQASKPSMRTVVAPRGRSVIVCAAVVRIPRTRCLPLCCGLRALVPSACARADARSFTLH